MRPSLRARLARAAALPVLALMLLVGAPSLAAADEVVATDEVIVLAAEGHSGPLPGPDPLPADDENNQFAPEDYEANFLWGAAVGFGAIVFLSLLALGALWWLMVVRPAQAKAGQPQG